MPRDFTAYREDSRSRGGMCQINFGLKLRHELRQVAIEPPAERRIAFAPWSGTVAQQQTGHNIVQCCSVRRPTGCALSTAGQQKNPAVHLRETAGPEQRRGQAWRRIKCYEAFALIGSTRPIHSALARNPLTC